jgi:hypothetical protein
MSDRPSPPHPDFDEESFSPKGALFLLVLYIIIFAAAWGLIYFGDLLARR